MKTNIFFLLSLHITAVSFLSGQTPYKKMVVEGNHWRISSEYCDVFAGCDPDPTVSGPVIFHYDTAYYKLQGDTIIDFIPYKFLWLGTYTTCPDCQPPRTYPQPPICTPYHVIGYMTEDTLNQKVFYKAKNPSCGDNYLFADFSLSTGDSLSLSYVSTGNFVNCDTNMFRVDSIGYTLVFQETVKTWYLTNTHPYINAPDAKLYEGIGYSYGFNLIYDLGDGTGYADHLIDFCQNLSDSCWIVCRTTGTQDILPDDNYISILPNPSSNFIAIKSNVANIIETELFDMTGRSVLSSQSDQVNIYNLSSGIYLALIKTNIGILRKRLVKE